MMPQIKITYRSICREYLQEDPAHRRARGRPRIRVAVNVEIESDADDKVTLFRLLSELAATVQEMNRPAKEQKMYNLPPPNI
jgi:hypothetical protein